MKNSASVNGDTSKCQYRVGYFINEKFLNIPFDTVSFFNCFQIKNIIFKSILQL